MTKYSVMIMIVMAMANEESDVMCLFVMKESNGESDK